MAQRTFPARPLRLLAAFLIAACPLTATAQDNDEPAGEPAPLFVNVAKEMKLTDVRGKDCILTDLNGDGYLDLVLDRQRFYLSEDGLAFKEHTEHGIPYPVLRHAPIDRTGKVIEDKVRERPYVPQYLYFADVDNDGDQDALYGVQASWEYNDGTGWKVQKDADHGQRSGVLLNDGQGTFARAPDSGYSAPDAFSQVMALAIVDVDRNGTLDLFEGAQYRYYGLIEGAVDRLWMGDGKGGFTDGTAAAGLSTEPVPATDRSSRPTYGVTHGDMDNDGRQDLLVMSYGRQWNREWRQTEDGRFEDAARRTNFAGDAIDHGKYPEWVKKRMKRADEPPFRANGNTFDCAIADFDNDGDLDCFLGEIAHAWAGESSDKPALLINQGPESGFTYERRGVDELLPKRPFRSEQNWNYGDLHIAWLDYDNDTLQDLLIASGDYPDGQFLRLYRQRPDHSFEEVTELAGFDWEGCGSVSLGDVDRDGDVDIVVGRSFQRLNKAHRDQFMGGITVNEVGVFRNDAANASGNHWLNVRLVGATGRRKKGSNRSGIGARITIRTSVGKAASVTQIREIRGGSGLANHQDPPEAWFGLGQAEAVDEIVVRWADAKGTEQRWTNVPADHFVTLEEGRPKPVLTAPPLR